MNSIAKFRTYRGSWSAARNYPLITIGVFLQALAVRLFLVPGHLVLSGIGQTHDIFCEELHPLKQCVVPLIKSGY